VGRGADPTPGFGPEAGRLVACSNEPPESEESNSLALRLPTAARGAVCRSAGASSLWTLDRSPDPFALADASASLFRLSWSMSRLNCLSAFAGNSTRWTLIKASSSSFIISEWSKMQGSEFGLPALGTQVRSLTSESRFLGYAKSVNRLDLSFSTKRTPLLSRKRHHEPPRACAMPAS
jgi:hypothetical protein